MASRRTNGVAIRELRAALGISQADLAAAAGVDRTAIWRIERGGSQPRPATLRKIADRLGVPIDAISHVVTEPEPENVASLPATQPAA
jgi:transcriptional regulator with XRE-family HTH domain